MPGGAEFYSQWTKQLKTEDHIHKAVTWIFWQGKKVQVGTNKKVPYVSTDSYEYIFTDHLAQRSHLGRAGPANSYKQVWHTESSDSCWGALVKSWVDLWSWKWYQQQSSAEFWWVEAVMMKGEAENEGGWWWWWSVGGIEQWSSTSISFYFERAKSNPMTSWSGFAQSKRNQEEPRGQSRRKVTVAGKKLPSGKEPQQKQSLQGGHLTSKKKWWRDGGKERVRAAEQWVDDWLAHEKKPRLKLREVVTEQSLLQAMSLKLRSNNFLEIFSNTQKVGNRAEVLERTAIWTTVILQNKWRDSSCWERWRKVAADDDGMN